MSDNNIDQDDQAEQPEVDATEVEGQDPPEDTTDAENAAQDDDQGDTFTREYVDKLRRENARYRTRAKDADALAERLHTELVRATGKLADPADLPFDAEHLADADKLAEAIDNLLVAKPHMASRRPSGDIGQGARESVPTGVSLSAMLRARS